MPQLKQDYNAFIVKLESRTLDWLTLLASYTLSESKGNQELPRGHMTWTSTRGTGKTVTATWTTTIAITSRSTDMCCCPRTSPSASTPVGDRHSDGHRSSMRTTSTDMHYGIYLSSPAAAGKAPTTRGSISSSPRDSAIGPTHLDLIVSVLNRLLPGDCYRGLRDGHRVRRGIRARRSHQLGEHPARWEVGFRLTF